MRQNSAYAVEATDLVKVFPRGNVRALDGVSLHVEEGTILGLLGPNGAGKTTAVRILSTILSPDSGRASILGHDVVKEAEAVRRIIGLAGQYAAVDENLTGRENIRMVGRLSHMSWKESRARATTLLKDFGLTDAGDRVLKTYSGGMRRRLDLAAALVARPPVLFLDEPTTGLDPQSRQDLWGVIENLVARGTTVLLTTQYLEEADRLARNIIVVDHGRVIAEGTPAALKARLGTSVVSISFSDSETATRAATLVAHISDKEPIVDHTTVELTVENGPQVGAEVLRTLDAAGVPIAGLALREPSLDDVFLSLTGHKSEPEAEAERARARGDDRGQGAGAQDGAQARQTARGPGQGERRRMTTITVPTIAVPAASRHRLRWTVADTVTITWRNLVAITRIPEALFFSTLQPIMFVLLFRYVFGGAIPIPGGVPYVDYMMPGIFVQTMLFGSVGTAVGLSEDLQKGLIERFRALPMARSAVLAGRTSADAVRNVFVMIIMTGVAYAVGFRIGAGVPDYLLGALLILAFAYARQLGLRGRRAGRAQQRDRAGHGLPDPHAAHLRLDRLRAAASPCRAGCRRSPGSSRSRWSSTARARSWWAATTTHRGRSGSPCSGSSGC